MSPENQPGTEPSAYEKLLAALQDDEETQELQTPRKPRFRRLSAVGGVALAGALVLVPAGVVYGIGAVTNREVIGHETQVTIDNPGEAEVYDVQTNMDMFPITLATAATKAEKVKVKSVNLMTSDLFNIEISVGEDNIERQAIVDTELQIDLKQITLDYDGTNDKLTITAPETSISSSVEIPTGGAKTTDSTSVGINAIQKRMSADMEGLQGTFDAMFPDANYDIPIVNDMIKGNLTYEQAMTNFADFWIETQVDKQCTPEIVKIPNFIDQIKDNIRKVVAIRILDVNETNGVFEAMTADPTARDRIKEIIAEAEVIIPETYSFKPDQKKLDQLADYAKVKMFEGAFDEEKPLVCKVADTVELEMVDDGVDND